MAQVVLENLTKVFAGNVAAVNDVSLTVADREFLVLVGPSGCGKTTTLRMIAGLEEATRGTICIGDRVVNDVAPKDRDIAMVFQNYALYPHMTAYRNMAFGLKLRGCGRREIDERVREAADILGLTDLLGRKPRALSGGQRQRVALGRAIVRKPQVFLFDEPLSNLDARRRVEMRAELKRLHRRLETTVVYVTHDQVEAMTLGERIAVMNEGVIQQVARPLDLYDGPANRFVAGFVGTPPMNFFDGAVRLRAAGPVFDAGSFSLPLAPAPGAAADQIEGRRVALGVRPEHLTLAGADASVTGLPVIPATVSVVEQRGDAQLVHLASGAHTFVARAEAHARVEVGAGVAVTLDPAEIHVFDRSTGAVLGDGRSSGESDRREA